MLGIRDTGIHCISHYLAAHSNLDYSCMHIPCVNVTCDYTCSGSLNQCVLLFGALSKGETFCVRSHTVKSIWKCRPPGGRHFDVGFINQALLAKVSLLDKAPFCGTSKPQSRPGNPTDKMKKMSIMANPIMSGGSLVFLTTAHNRAMSSHVQNRLSTDTYVTQRPNLLRENGYVV